MKQIEITSWKVRAYDFYSRVEKYRKRSSECSEQVSFPINFNDRVNKIRTKHFPLCYLFILLVLRFICEYLSVES